MKIPIDFFFLVGRGGSGSRGLSGGGGEPNLGFPAPGPAATKSLENLQNPKNPALYLVLRYLDPNNLKQLMFRLVLRRRRRRGGGGRGDQVSGKPKKLCIYMWCDYMYICIYVYKERKRTREDTRHNTHTRLVCCVYITRNLDCKDLFVCLFVYLWFACLSVCLLALCFLLFFTLGNDCERIISPELTHRLQPAERQIEWAVPWLSASMKAREPRPEGQSQRARAREAESQG